MNWKKGLWCGILPCLSCSLPRVMFSLELLLKGGERGWGFEMTSHVLRISQMGKAVIVSRLCITVSGQATIGPSPKQKPPPPTHSPSSDVRHVSVFASFHWQPRILLQRIIRVESQGRWSMSGLLEGKGKWATLSGRCYKTGFLLQQDTSCKTCHYYVRQ